MLRNLKAILIDWPTTMTIPSLTRTKVGKRLDDAAIRAQWEAYASARLKTGVCDTLHSLSRVHHLHVVPLSLCGPSLTKTHHTRLWANLPVTDPICEDNGSFQVFRAMEAVGVTDVRSVLRVSQHKALIDESLQAGVHCAGIGGEFEFRGIHPCFYEEQAFVGVDSFDELVALIANLRT